MQHIAQILQNFQFNRDTDSSQHENDMNKDSLASSTSNRKEKEQKAGNLSIDRQKAPHSNTNRGSPAYFPPAINVKTTWPSNRISGDDRPSSSGRKHDYGKPGDVPNTDVINQVDVSRLTENLTKMIYHQQNDNNGFLTKRPKEFHKTDSAAYSDNSGPRDKKTATTMDETQTQQIKKILVDCLQNIDRNLDENPKEKHDPKHSHRKQGGKTQKCPNNENIAHNNAGLIKSSGVPSKPESKPETLTKTSLLRSYLSGSNPTREEYISKRRNVSNSLISSDSVHHSIFLESGRERRQCLLQYLSNVVGDGQVVIYVNSIPGAEALMNFLTKHGFHVNAVHPRLLLAESNWILSEFSLKKFSVLLCAEDHYHSCPAHFRYVKTIINYELPISNPMENWSIRNGIVEFSDSLPVHIYTFIKKSCPLDHELVKLLRLDSQEDQELLPVRP